MEGCAASGAYWIASACDAIIANEYSRIGSIGVILGHFDISEFAKKLGLRYDGVHSGEYKDMGSMFRPFTDKEREMLQEGLDEVHEGFIDAIAMNRDMSSSDIREIANGLTYHGNESLANGLIDAIGDQRLAIKHIEKRGGFTNGRVVDYTPKKKGLLRTLGIGAVAYDIGNSIAQGFLERISDQNRNVH